MKPRPHLAGFTLIEVMVVVAILGLLATLVVQNVIPQHEESKVTKARTDVATLTAAAKMFLLQRGRVPALPDLVARDGSRPPMLDDLPRDPWDHDYELLTGPAKDEFAVVSAGPDGQLGSEDDIRSHPAH